MKGVKAEASLFPERIPKDLTIPEEVLELTWKCALRIANARTRSNFLHHGVHICTACETIQKKVVPESCVALHRQPKGPNGNSNRRQFKRVVLTPLHVYIR